MRRLLRKICIYLPDIIVMQIDNLRTYGRLLNLKKPKYYGEKIQWIKAKGNLERYKNIVDKYLVREYIKNAIGEEYLPKLIAVYNKENEIDYSILPEKFVLKLNDGSDRIIICRDKASLDIEKTNKRLRKLLKEDYYKYTKEHQYKGIKKKIICEEYLEDKSGDLVEYALHCFSGKVKLIEVHTNRSTNYREDYFEVDWTKIPMKGKAENSLKPIEKPKFLDKLIYLGEILAKDFEYIRVDFNAVDERLYFSELTLTPANGTDKFNPLEYDLKIAGLINLENYNKPFNFKEV
ncbi:ATP-grasp fold amidoligase family protein [Clostridium sp.]|uniref:ATP-grasp fold amidoligase family protein n=1 Tax=Clostridium sp. TaxID=1506 RepID=UPI00291145F6|nr:ATP-grasp fold amidoligase family protein [Clostridium sp.]MDU5107832.1 ATP-grasp fold amidoligase family protein [Clostridium sp.]